MTIDVLKNIPNDSKHNANNTCNIHTIQPNASVRRALFGEVDHEECSEFFEKQFKTLLENQKIKYNFDFVNEKPVDDPQSEYEWFPIQSDEVIPKAYALSRLPYLYKHSTVLDTDSNNSSDISFKQSNDHLSLPTSGEIIRVSQSIDFCRLRDNATEVTFASAKLVQTSIEDYMKLRKRSICHKNEENQNLSKYEKTECGSSCYHPQLKESSVKKLCLSPTSE